ncbi:hypothetical protein FHR81_003783 [Actinoalloteichus hoggarensis]|uniref:Uncharacterized protein n=2 Tax=Actinoalloteichus TaxID=65496 RepID=A0A221WAV0_9PSEU|nr:MULTISPECIES: hypothetical protein [Actinoalloteichus]APU17978.1 hypothetical protein UA74_29935 [Actinoalloteichus fjordicus]APU24057.1 hypothetical protein UA75_30470 [Actinoalloteichus sp. GBA129-24]ASO23120.1 hypothetical protein AHOG_27615 [Actinoalloteichus hoggarensis]MBB5922726.1 hypothetical protein [Actinoalloteichus hoggarensis]
MNLAARLRLRRNSSTRPRTNKALQEAIDSASSPALRDELLIIAQRHNLLNR